MSQDTAVPRPLTPADLGRAAEVMSRAFQSDPLFRFLLPDDAERARLSPRFFDLILSFAIHSGRAYGLSDPLEGVAVWTAPGHRTAPGAAMRGLLDGRPHRLLIRSLMLQAFRGRRILIETEMIHRRCAPDPHYYLEAIAVLPESQGRGLASRLIRPFLDRADAEDVSVYLETMAPENIGLYEHYGFRCVERYDAPGAALSVWAFYRPPAGSGG